MLAPAELYLGAGVRALDGGRALGANVNFIRQGSWDQPDLVNATRRLLGSGGGLIRFPAGNAANYWDWRTGWCLAEFAGADYPCKGLPPRPYTLEDLARGVALTGAAPVMTLNVLTSNISEQLDMLARARALGLSLARLELGNELYWGKHAASFPTGTAYGLEMNAWVAALRAAGHGGNLYLTLQDSPGVGRNSVLGTWNDAVLAATVADSGVGGVFHVYRSPDDRLVAGLDPAQSASGQWADAAVQEYTYRALRTTGGLEGYLGMPQWNWRHDPFLTAPNLAGRPLLVSEYNIVEHSGGGLRMSWAHGLYIAGTALSFWRLPTPPAGAMVHVLSGINGGFGWATFFSGADQARAYAKRGPMKYG